jgi:GTP-binding protein
VAVNKIDLPQVRERLAEIRDSFSACRNKVFFISAVSGEGISELMAETMKMLSAAKPEAGRIKKVFRPQPKI